MSDRLNKRAAVRAFAQVYADSAYFWPRYHEPRRWLREAAASVVAPLLGRSPKAVLAVVAAEPRVPWIVAERAAWADRVTTTLLGGQ